MKRCTVTRFLVILSALVLLVLAGSSPTYAQTPEATPVTDPQPVTPDDVLARADAASAAAQEAADRADTVLNVLNTLLSFVQVAAILGGLLATLAAVLFSLLGVRTFREYGAVMEENRKEMAALREQLVQNMSEAETTLKKVEYRINEEVSAIRAQGDRSIRALALLQLGEQQMEARNPIAALRTFGDAFRLDPNNRATNYFLGELYLQQRDLKLAMEHLERALAGDDDYPPAEGALGAALRLQADKETDPNRKNLLYAQAEQRLLKALAADSFIRDPYGESYYGALGGLYRRQNRVDDAIRAFQEAEKLTPQNSYPINNLAMLYTMKGIPDRARHMFERAIAISSRSLDGNPFDYWARFDLITAQVGLDQLDKANEHLRIVMDQLKEPGPYESFMRGLLTLRESPVPPPRIGEFIHTVQQHIDKLKKS